MRTITVNKKDLLEILRTNRNDHGEVYERAIEGYRREAVAMLEAWIDEAKDERKAPTLFRWSLPIPEDHTDDYSRVIGMLEMDLADTVELTEAEFAQYVQDDWGWKQQWTASVSNYTSTNP